ncbi:MAG TPA: beta-1-3, beta-1-6-glucan biosynthesis protein [Xanthobacteraceae bacterium]|nr:beta-1-3, beta-1-6-glucan biosynthesis protein [Xanthobacteraceae bacterium]
MVSVYSRFLTAVQAAVVFAGVAHAQSGPAKAPGQPAGGQAAVEAAKDRQKEELAEAGRLLKGPEGSPECVWLGRRVVALLWRDDVDTALRHLQIYSRFGCPDAHIQSTFRCVLSQGPVDSKVPDSLNSRIHACWITPAPAAASEAASRTRKR